MSTASFPYCRVRNIPGESRMGCTFLTANSWTFNGTSQTSQLFAVLAHLKKQIPDITKLLMGVK